MIALSVAIVLGLAAWAAFGGKDSEGRVTITNDSQVAGVAQEAERLSLQHLKDYDAGAELSQQDKADVRRAAAHFDSLTAYKSKDIRTYFGAGKCYQAAGNDDAAIKRLRDGLATLPPPPVPAEFNDTAIEAHYVLSVSLFNKKDYEGAMKEVSTAIAMFPGSPIYLSQRASIYVQMRPPKYVEAAHDLLRALTIDPQHKRSLGLLKLVGMAASDAFKVAASDKLNKRDYKGVVQDCTTGLGIAPGYAPLLALRAAAYIELGKKAEAKDDIEALRRIDPNSKDAQTLDRQLK
ncbi:MAG: tetratricopeptide repeat protein [Fimbriimonadales bacterium]